MARSQRERYLHHWKTDENYSGRVRRPNQEDRVFSLVTLTAIKSPKKAGKIQDSIPPDVRVVNFPINSHSVDKIPFVLMIVVLGSIFLAVLILIYSTVFFYLHNDGAHFYCS